MDGGIVTSSTSDCLAGLDLDSDTIIEVACIITDGELERVIEAFPPFCAFVL